MLLITLALWMSAAQAFAEPIRPWWVEGAFASADLAPLSRPSAQPAALPERLPSVLTLFSALLTCMALMLIYCARSSLRKAPMIQARFQKTARSGLVS